jgi:hypothetical protein
VPPDVRVVIVRTGIVLARDGGALARMLPSFELFAGGPLGTGRQWLSWIHRDDLVALITTALADPSYRGTYNGTAPRPVTQAQLCSSIGALLGKPRCGARGRGVCVWPGALGRRRLDWWLRQDRRRPCPCSAATGPDHPRFPSPQPPSWLPVPDFAISTLLGEGARVVLDGQRVLPSRTQQQGFRWGRAAARRHFAARAARGGGRRRRHSHAPPVPRLPRSARPPRRRRRRQPSLKPPS